MVYGYTTRPAPDPNRGEAPRIKHQELYTLDPMTVFEAVLGERQKKQPWQANLYQAR